MQRFFCPSLQQISALAGIDDAAEVHHLTRVLRLKEGEAVELLNGQGLAGRGRIACLGKDRVDVQIDAVETAPAPAAPRCILACAIPKRSKFETIIEKATELGVDEIVPLVTARTEYHTSRDKAERFDEVMRSAARQSRRLWFPRVHPVMPFTRSVEVLAVEGNRLFIPWLEGGRVLLKDAFAALPLPAPSAIVFFIGPEGDFTPPEAALLIGRGAVPVSLGATILRVETAAIAVAAYHAFHCR